MGELKEAYLALGRSPENRAEDFDALVCFCGEAALIGRFRGGDQGFKSKSFQLISRCIMRKAESCVAPWAEECQNRLKGLASVPG